MQRARDAEVGGGHACWRRDAACYPGPVSCVATLPAGQVTEGNAMTDDWGIDPTYIDFAGKEQHVSADTIEALHEAR
jgi:hypothetical protein